MKDFICKVQIWWCHTKKQFVYDLTFNDTTKKALDKIIQGHY